MLILVMWNGEALYPSAHIAFGTAECSTKLMLRFYNDSFKEIIVLILDVVLHFVRRTN